MTSGVESNIGDSYGSNSEALIFNKDHLSLEKIMYAIGVFVNTSVTRVARVIHSWNRDLLNELQRTLGRAIGPDEIISRGHLNPLSEDDERLRGLRSGSFRELFDAFNEAITVRWINQSDGVAASARASASGTTPCTTPAPELPAFEHINKLRCFVNIFVRHTLEHQHDRARKRLMALKYNPEHGIETLWHDVMLFRTLVDRCTPSMHTMFMEIAKLVPADIAQVLLRHQSDFLTAGGPNFTLMSEKIADCVRAAEFANQLPEPLRNVRVVNAAEQLTGTTEATVQTLSAQVAMLNARILALSNDQVRHRGPQQQQQQPAGSNQPRMTVDQLMTKAKYILDNNLCSNCEGSDHRSRECPKPKRSQLRQIRNALNLVSSSRPGQTRQYSSVVFTHAELLQAPGELLKWLVDSGAQVTLIDADSPLARKIRWESPRMRLVAAGGEVLRVRGEATTTLRFKAGEGKKRVERRVRLQLVEGLEGMNILGGDVLFAKGDLHIRLEQSTGHGTMRLGPGEIVPVETPEEATLTVQAITAGLNYKQIRKMNCKQQSDKKVLLKIGKTPIRQTLIEAPDEQGEVKPKTGDAKVTLSSHLTESQKAAVLKLLAERRGAFANTEEEVGIAKGYRFNVHLLDENPVTSGKHRRVPYHLRDKVTAMLQDMERQGVIRKSLSPYCSGLVVVQKADGSLRICVDYKDLNAKTADDGYQLPLVEEQLNKLQGSKYFTGLDLFRGYHQLRVDKDSQALTAFNGNGVHYEYCVLPFGPKNGPAAFARFVFLIVGDMQAEGKPIIIFFDDIIIGGVTFEEHVKLVEEVLRRLEEAGVTIKSSKARFAMEEIPCLGFIVGRDGVKPDPEKVDAIRSFPRPVNQSQLRGFLGLLNFYGSMVPNLQEIVHPLNRALSKDETLPKKELDWSPAMISAFDRAKDLFSQKVLTQLPDLSQPFILTTDASECGLGACLSQRGEDGRERPIAFFSKGVDPKEVDPDTAVIKTRELELYAFLLATRKWRHYLYGRSFEWHTDHKPLLWDEKNPTKKVASWLAELKELDFTSVYVKGEENVVADTLSRHGFAKPAGVIAALSAGPRIFVPREGREEVLAKFHDAKGHPGGRATVNEIAKHFFWPGLRQDVMKWCESCDVCQKSRRGGTADLRDEVTTQMTKPFRGVTMDLVKLDEAQLLVIECLFSRFAETYLLPAKAAEGVHRAYMQFFRRYRIPELVRSDNGTEFNTLGVASIELGFEWSRSSPHNPPSNGAVERLNGTLINEIIKLRSEGFELADAVEVGTSLYNNRTHSATGHSPYELVFGERREDPDLVLEQVAPRRVNLKSAASRWAQGRARRDREAFQRATERDAAGKHQRLEERPTERFKVGDLVLIPRINRRKTQSKWVGPYEIIQVRQGGTYRAKNCNNFRDRVLRHHRYLRKYIARDGVVPKPQPRMTRSQPAESAELPSAGPRLTFPQLPDPQPEEEEASVPATPMSDISAAERLAEFPPDGSPAVDSAERRDDDVAMDTLMTETADASARAEDRKALARERRPLDDESEAPVVQRRTSPRTNAGQPPRKYLVDQVQSLQAKIARVAARLEHWRRSSNPVKQLALHIWNTRNRNASSWGGGV